LRSNPMVIPVQGSREWLRPAVPMCCSCGPRSVTCDGPLDTDRDNPSDCVSVGRVVFHPFGGRGGRGCPPSALLVVLFGPRCALSQFMFAPGTRYRVCSFDYFVAARMHPAWRSYRESTVFVLFFFFFKFCEKARLGSVYEPRAYVPDRVCAAGSRGFSRASGGEGVSSFGCARVLA
jgi:hypothetical protein